MLDMSTEQFLLALRRFIGRRSTPNLLINDNPKKFKGASKFLKKLFKSTKVKQFFAKKRIEWSFNLSRPPWYGSIYERLIKSVKRCAKKVLKNAKVTFHDLSGNRRYIEQQTFNVNELEEFNQALTLSHLSGSKRYIEQQTVKVYELEGFNQALTLSHLICGRRLEQLLHFRICTRLYRNWH